MFYAPHLAFYLKALKYKSPAGVCTAFERYNNSVGLLFANKLNIVREFIRGDADVLNDLIQSWEVYETIYGGDD